MEPTNTSWDPEFPGLSGLADMINQPNSTHLSPTPSQDQASSRTSSGSGYESMCGDTVPSPSSASPKRFKQTIHAQESDSVTAIGSALVGKTSNYQTSEALLPDYLSPCPAEFAVGMGYMDVFVYGNMCMFSSISAVFSIALFQEVPSKGRIKRFKLSE